MSRRPAGARSPQRELTAAERREAWLTRQLAAAPPLSSDQADLLRRVLKAPADAEVA